jgi:hypothetical protein
MTGIELKYVTMAHLDLTGNCYWLLDGVTDDMSHPRAIYPLNPGRVRVKLDKSPFHRGCVKTQMRDRRMVGRLAVSDCRISTDLLRSMSF